MRWQSMVLVSMLVVLSGCLDGSPEPLPPEMQEQASPQTANADPEATTNTPQQAESTTSPESSVASNEPEESNLSAHVPVNKPQIAPRPNVSISKPHTMAHQTTKRSEEDEQWATPEELGGAQQKAGVGMGRKGHGYGKDPFTYALAANFRAREKIILQHIAKAMQLYNATNGHYPRTQEEFRKEIIKANAIKMPALPSGRKYYYDAEEGVLTVINVP